MIENITTATPVEIDTRLAALYDTAAGLVFDARLAADRVFSYAGMRREGDKPRYRDERTVGTIAEAIAKCESGEGIESYYVASARKAVAALTEIREAIAANREEQRPLHAEFTRRGGWTRAFLVLASNGHVHSSMNCNTCYEPRMVNGEWKPGTAYGWLPSLSGHDEAEIVAASGSDACTVCFPSAPVETAGARTVLHHTEEQAQAARDEKARIKAEKDAAKAAKALVLDLRPYGVDSYAGRIETLASAKSYLTNAAEWNQNGNTHPYYPTSAVLVVAEAVAAKVGTSAVAEIEAAVKRAAKRR